MIELHTLRPSQQRNRYKRVGRGNASGKGTTAGRGTKGQRARTGGRNKLTRRGLKHLIERTPKTRGFRSRRPTLAVIPLDQLTARFADGQTITPTAVLRAGLMSKRDAGYKVIGSHSINKKLVVRAHAFSAGASAAITKAGGQATPLKTTTPTPSKE